MRLVEIRPTDRASFQHMIHALSVNRVQQSLGISCCDCCLPYTGVEAELGPPRGADASCYLPPDCICLCHSRCLLQKPLCKKQNDYKPTRVKNLGTLCRAYRRSGPYLTNDHRATDSRRLWLNKYRRHFADRQLLNCAFSWICWTSIRPDPPHSRSRSLMGYP